MEDDTRPSGEASPQRADSDAIAEQLNQTTSEDAGGNVSGTGDSPPSQGTSNFEIVFDAEDTEHDGH